MSVMLPSKESEFDESWGYREPVAPKKLFVQDFELPGHGERSSWCGEKRLRICREHDKHVHKSLDGVDVVGKDVIEIYHASCGKISCPVCYEKAAGLMARKIEHRFNHFKFRSKFPKPIHVVVSVPASLYGLDAKKLRSLAVDHVKEVGVHGGCVIYHAWRERCAECGAEIEKFERLNGDHLCTMCNSVSVVWVYSPHFHCIGLGWAAYEKVRDGFNSHGWVVVNLGVRKSVRQTAQYQLSHCSVAKGFSNVVWFGSMVKMKYPKLPLEKHVCPLCGGEMEKLVLNGWNRSVMKSELMDDVDEGFYFVDPGMFEYQESSEDGG